MSDPYDRVLTRYNKLLLQNMELQKVHNPYNQDVRKSAAIENGEAEELIRIQEQEDYDSRRGILSMDPLRQEIDMGIVVVTLARSAAMRAGVPPEACFSLSDATIQEMEGCKDVATVKYLYLKSEVRYCMMVRDHKRQRETFRNADTDSNLHISHCKDYIFSHLNGKLTVEQIADAIGLEANYLSALWREKEQCTLKQYILQEKITLCKNMLAYSPYSYIEIANYLGFSSQSHLGERFKKVTGMTLREYRDRYAKEDFLQSVVETEKEEQGAPLV